MPLANDAYGRTVEFSTDGVTDRYLVGGSITYPFAANTALSTVYLSIARQEKIRQFGLVIRTYISSRYDLDTRLNLNALYTHAQQTLLTNRLAYIFQIFSWINSVTSYASTFINSVNANTDANSVAAMTWDLSQISADPLISPLVAVTIMN